MMRAVYDFYLRRSLLLEMFGIGLGGHAAVRIWNIPADKWRHMNLRSSRP
jgi:hypothetical protein